MKKNSLFFIFLLTLCAASCTPTDASSVTYLPTDALDSPHPTPITDGFDLSLKDNLDGKKFAGYEGDTYDHYGYVSLRSCTDGDTANFIQEGYVDDANAYVTIKTRFLGVNTPESTAKVEPWGKKASLFTKKVLEAAQAEADLASTAIKKVYNIVLVNNPTDGGFEEKDSSGNRWLAFVWYRRTHTSNWRLLNLELVEQGYSRNQLFTDDSVCNYRSKFEQAETNAMKCPYRVYGEVDPGFDYEEKVYEYSLWSIIKKYDEIGISDSGDSGFQLCITALIVGVQGDSMFLRDVLIDEEQYKEEGDDAKFAGLYAYAGYNSGLSTLFHSASSSLGMDGNGPGLIVRFYCRATLYSGNIQLSDVKNSTTGKKAFQIIREANFNKFKDEYKWSHVYSEKGDVELSDLNTNITPITLDSSNISAVNGTSEEKYPDLVKYQYQFVTTTVTIRSVDPSFDSDDDGSGISQGGYWYKPTVDSTAYTLYCYMIGKDGKKLYINVRFDDSISPKVLPTFFGGDTADRFNISGPNSPVGKSYKVTGYFAKYYQSYQIQFPNNYSTYNYISAL